MDNLFLIIVAVSMCLFVVSTVWVAKKLNSKSVNTVLSWLIGGVAGLFVWAFSFGFLLGLSGFTESDFKLDSDAANIMYPDNLSVEDKNIIDNALVIMGSQCEPLNSYWDDVESAEASILESYPYQERQNGWKRQVYIKVKIKDTTEHIPFSYRAFGHTCHYALGVGHTPGVYGGKKPCNLLCNIPNDSTTLADFVSIPDLAY